jgi:hypothetical protein
LISLMAYLGVVQTLPAPVGSAAGAVIVASDGASAQAGEIAMAASEASKIGESRRFHLYPNLNNPNV